MQERYLRKQNVVSTCTNDSSFPTIRKLAHLVGWDFYINNYLIKNVFFFSLNDFFSYINFGPRANRFLQSCGVKDEPSSIEYAELLIKSSHKLLQLIGVEKYLKILKKIANDFSSFGNMASRIGLVSRMKKHRF